MDAAPSQPTTRREKVRFATVVVCGAVDGDAAILMEQALPLLAATRPLVRLVELPARHAAPLARRGRPLEPVASIIGGLGLTLRREPGLSSAETVVADVLASDADLVIKGVALPRDARAALDPVDLELIRRCPCPVWMVDCTEPRPPRRVLALLRPRSDEAAENGLAHETAEVSARFAAATGAALGIFHAWEPPGAPAANPASAPPPLVQRAAEEQVRKRLRPALQAAGVPDEEAGVDLVEGRFLHALAHFLGEQPVDLVVMGTRGRNDWLDAVVRPHAETVLCQMRVPVLVVKEREERQP